MQSANGTAACDHGETIRVILEPLRRNLSLVVLRLSTFIADAVRTDLGNGSVFKLMAADSP